MSAKIKLEDMSKEELIEIIRNLMKENEKLKKEIKKYKNPHTPPSKQSFDKPQAQGLKVGRKNGKKSNHKGKTRALEEPTKTIEVTADFNPKTGNYNIEELDEYKERTIIDFEIEKTVKLYRIHYYKDIDTGEIFAATHPDLPDKGIFGKNTLAFANVLHYDYRVPFDGVANIFTNIFEIPMSAPTALDISNRVANKLSCKYNELNDELKNSKIVNENL